MRKAIGAIVTLLIASQVCLAEVPRLFQEKDFTAASFAEAVNHFVTLGEDAAVQELRGLTMDGHKDFTDHGSGAWSVNARIGWMCRVLFSPKGSEPLREPAFGALGLPRHTMPLKSWPLYPIALSGSTYFVLSEGYSSAGRPEDPKAYIDYCRENGVFRNKEIPVPSREQALKDAAALRESKVWKDIKWTDSGNNWSYSFRESEKWKFIQNQADSIP